MKSHLKVFVRIIRFCAFGILLGTSVSWAGEKFAVLTDLDDTIKISNVSDPSDAAWNGLFGEKAFLGMSRLYRNWGPSSFYILSGSPSFLRGRVEDFVEDNKFPSGQIILKNWFGGQETAQYKRENIERILKATQLPFLLVGDDTEQDPEVLSEAQKNYPDRIAGVYIHRVAGRALPDGVTAFYTSFDIALDEVAQGRLTPSQAVEVGREILNGKSKLLFPEYALCPKDADYLNPGPWHGDPDLGKMRDQVLARIAGICLKRH